MKRKRLKRRELLALIRWLLARHTDFQSGAVGSPTAIATGVLPGERL